MKTFVLVLIIIFIVANAFMLAMLCRQTPEEKALEDEEQMEYLNNLDKKDNDSAKAVSNNDHVKDSNTDQEDEKDDNTETDL